MTPLTPHDRPQGMLFGVAASFFTVVLIRTAWVSEPALLTLRTVEHAASGFGLRWNVVERVQVPDHPLWLLVLLGGRLVTGDTYLTTIAIGMVCSLICLWIVLRHTRSDPAAVFALAAVTLSPLFVSYSTSGLETALTHALVVGCAAVVWRHDGSTRSVLLLAILTGLALLTRWTNVLLLSPIVLPMLARPTRRLRAISAALALGPLLLWLIWSFWYYGALAPNGWLADWTAQVPLARRVEAGASFLLATATLDPLMVGLTIIGCAIGLITGGPDTRVALGALLASAWAVLSGGSPMAGLGLTAPFIVGLLLALRGLRSCQRRTVTLAAAVVVLIGTLIPTPTYSADARYGAAFRATALAHDGRAELYQATGLLLHARLRPVPAHPEAERARQLRASGEVVATSPLPGIFGMAAGPAMYVLDPHGTTDPLLARLPPAVGARWLWGSERRLPDGYLASLPDRDVALAEPSLARLYSQLRQVTRGPLAPGQQWRSVTTLRAETPSLLAASSYGPAELRLTQTAGTGEARPLGEGGVNVRFDSRRNVAHIGAVLSVRFDYVVDVLDGDRVLATLETARLGWDPGPDRVRYLALDPPRPATGLRFRCGRGIGPCTLGDVTVGG